MKLSAWAKLQGMPYKTVHRWYKEGKMPCEVVKMPSGALIVKDSASVNKTTKVVVYARVSSNDRKDCLTTQVERCVQFANSLGLSVDKIYKEVASGMNDKRKQLIDMLDSKPTHIIVEHKDRLTRFGFNYLELLLKQHDSQILVLNKDEEAEPDLIKDMISIVTSFCCRLYGMRRGLNKTKKIKAALISDEN